MSTKSAQVPRFSKRVKPKKTQQTHLIITKQASDILFWQLYLGFLKISPDDDDDDDDDDEAPSKDPDSGAFGTTWPNGRTET